MIHRIDKAWHKRIGTKGAERIVRFGVAIAMLCSAIGLVGWLFGLRSKILDQDTSTKPVTTVAMMALAGAMLAIRNRHLTVASTLIIGVMALMLLTVQAAMNMVGLDERLGGPGMVPSLPSAGSIMTLTLCAVGLFIWMIGNGPLRPVRRACGFIAIASGMSALIGHVIGVEVMYWSLPKVSTGMAIHTAIGMIALGCAVHEIDMRRPAPPF